MINKESSPSHAPALVFMHKDLRATVIPARIAGIHDCKDAGGTIPWMGEVELRREQQSRAMHGAIAEKPWMAIPKLATSFAKRNCLMTSIPIPVLWFPAIPAGMTCF